MTNSFSSLNLEESSRGGRNLDLNQLLETGKKYKRVTYLGSGSFGEVWIVEDKGTKERFAMKCIERGKNFDKYLAREIIIQKSLCHSNVIQFKEVVLSSTFLGIVMEYAEGGNLHDKIFESKKVLDEDTARYCFQEFVSGVFYLHSKGICHRDLKPENIILDRSDPPRLKICDFGYSKSDQLHSKPKSAVGTPQYTAPEVGQIEYNGKLADVFSCGLILYTMLARKLPNYRPNDTGETSNGKNAYLSDIPKYVSTDCKDLLARMLVPNPIERITIEEVQKHQWFKKSLRRELAEATQVTRENPRFSFQTDGEIKEIVEEAKILIPVEDDESEEEDDKSEFERGISSYLE